MSWVKRLPVYHIKYKRGAWVQFMLWRMFGVELESSSPMLWRTFAMSPAAHLICLRLCLSKSEALLACHMLQQILTDTGEMSIWLSWMLELLSTLHTQWRTEQHSRSQRWTSNKTHTTHQIDTEQCRWSQQHGIQSLYSEISKGGIKQQPLLINTRQKTWLIMLLHF